MIPVMQVLEDMASDNSIASLAARDYYKDNYANSKEKRSMDLEDHLITTMMVVFLIGAAFGVLVSVVLHA